MKAQSTLFQEYQQQVQIEAHRWASAYTQKMALEGQPVTLGLWNQAFESVAHTSKEEFQKQQQFEASLQQQRITAEYQRILSEQPSSQKNMAQTWQVAEKLVDAQDRATQAFPSAQEIYDLSKTQMASYIQTLPPHIHDTLQATVSGSKMDTLAVSRSHVTKSLAQDEAETKVKNTKNQELGTQFLAAKTIIEEAASEAGLKIKSVLGMSAQAPVSQSGGLSTPPDYLSSKALAAKTAMLTGLVSVATPVLNIKRAVTPTVVSATNNIQNGAKVAKINAVEFGKSVIGAVSGKAPVSSVVKTASNFVTGHEVGVQAQRLPSTKQESKVAMIPKSSGIVESKSLAQGEKPTTSQVKVIATVKQAPVQVHPTKVAVAEISEDGSSSKHKSKKEDRHESKKEKKGLEQEESQHSIVHTVVHTQDHGLDHTIEEAHYAEKAHLNSIHRIESVVACKEAMPLHKEVCVSGLVEGDQEAQRLAQDYQGPQALFQSDKIIEAKLTNEEKLKIAVEESASTKHASPNEAKIAYDQYLANQRSLNDVSVALGSTITTQDVQVSKALSI